MDELERQLQGLALAAQIAPPKTEQRRRALSQLLSALQHSGRLAYPQRGKFQGFYGEVRALALQGLFIYVCEHIHLYDPKRATVLAWVNYLLSRRFFHEASREFMHTLPKGVDSSFQCLSIDDLEGNIPAAVPDTLPAADYNQLRQLLQTDPDQCFQSTHVRHHPQATFQTIALGRLDEKSWDALSQELKVKVPTLSGFYQTALERFKPVFRKYLNP